MNTTTVGDIYFRVLWGPHIVEQETMNERGDKRRM